MQRSVSMLEGDDSDSELTLSPRCFSMSVDVISGRYLSMYLRVFTNQTLSSWVYANCPPDFLMVVVGGVGGQLGHEISSEFATKVLSTVRTAWVTFDNDEPFGRSDMDSPSTKPNLTGISDATSSSSFNMLTFGPVSVSEVICSGQAFASMRRWLFR